MQPDRPARRSCDGRCGRWTREETPVHAWVVFGHILGALRSMLEPFWLASATGALVQATSASRLPYSVAGSSRMNRASTRARRGPASFAALRTSPWLSGVAEMPAPLLVTSDTATTRIPT